MKRHALSVLAALFLFLIVIFFPLFFQQKAFFFGDNFTLMIPGKLFAVNTIKHQKILPFWQPYLLSGTPFLADINQSLFYPSTLFFYVFDPGDAVNITVLTHLLIGGLGVCALLYRKTKSTVLAIGCGCLWIVAEPTMGWSNSFTFLQTGAWTPWLLYVALGEKTRFFRYVPIITLAILGGHPQPLIYTLAVITMYFLFTQAWGKLLSLIIACVMSVMVLLPVLVPFAEFSSMSTRNAASITEKVSGSLHPLHLIHWIIPSFFSNPSIGIAWGPDWDHIRMVCGYMTLAGIAGVGISIFNYKKLQKIDWFFILLAIFSIGFSCLGNFPVLAQVVYHIPLLNSFRNPSAAIFLYILSVLYLLPNFFAFLKQFPVKKIILPLLLIWIVCAGLLFVWKYHSHTLWTTANSISHQVLERSQIHTYTRDLLIVSNILQQTCITLGLFILVLLCFPRFHNMAILLIILDVYLANQSLLFFAPKTIYQTRSGQVAEIMSKNNNQSRVLSLSGYVSYTGIDDYWKNMYIKPPFGDSLFQGNETKSFSLLHSRKANLAVNWNQVYSIPSVDGYATMLLKSATDYWKSPNSPQTRINYVDKVDPADKRLDDQGVAYFTVDKTALSPKRIPEEYNHFPVIVESSDWAVLENPHALPIIRYVSYPQGTINRLPGTVNDIHFEASNATDSSILIKVTPYPGWSCMVDGRKCQIQTDSLGMRLDAPAGKHTYRLSFIPTGWPQTVWVSGVCIVGNLYWWWKRRND